MRRILLRFDDICPTMNWKQWEIADSIMRKHGIKPVIGVIPDCQDGDLLIEQPHIDFWEYIKKLKNDNYSIAMHGYQHIFDIQHKALVTNRLDSEFAGHTYDEQYRKIKNGLDILHEHDIDTDIFFAPAHSYDEITLRVLYDCGFKYVLDGKSSKIIVRNGVYCIPCRDAGVPHIYGNGIFVAIFHAHEWAKESKIKEFEKFKKLCRNKDICSFFDIIENEKVGNTIYGICSEKAFMWYDYKIRPFLSKCKNSLSRFIRRLNFNNFERSFYNE